MAGVSFWTLGCKPPISWMGGKSGYSRVIAELLGLSRLNPPRAYVWGDVGPNIAALACLFGAAGSAEEVARYLAVAFRSFPGQEAGAGFKDYEGHAAKGTRGAPSEPWGTLADSTGAISSPRAPEVAAIIRGWRDEEPRALWTRLKAAGWPSLLLPEGSGGRWLGPCDVQEVASFLAHYVRSHPGGGGFIAPDHRMITGSRAGDVFHRYLPEDPAPAIEALPTKPPMVACWQGRAEDMRLPERLDGWIMYVDGPYHGDGSRKITGYKHGGCSRETQLALAAEWHRRGALVAVSESVPLGKELSALTGHPWETVDIAPERKGQKRTFSAETGEWVTMNRKPVVVPGVQASLFGAP
jgi:hypothetical protein